jgi:tripartite-type tricarboxylate transporter receptor subunit TctC
MHIRRSLLMTAAALALGGLGTQALAQGYPVKPVTVIVPFAAGGATDLLARVVTKALERYSGQPFIVENAGGAGATLGTSKVAAAAPDGYTLLLGGSSALVMAPHLFKNLKYDPFTSFEPVAKIASAPYVVVTKADSPIKTFGQLVDYARKNPDKMNFGSPGEGSALHLTIELMKDGAQMEGMHIPFRGSSHAWTALLGGDVTYIIDTPSGAIPMLKAQKAQALAVTSTKRLPELPNVPTLDELGLKGFESQAWFAMLAPKGTPAEAVSKLEGWVEKALRDPEVVETLQRSYFSPAGRVEGGLGGEMRRESEKWGRIIKSRKIQIQ